METDRTVVAGGRHGLHQRTTLRPALFFEGLVQDLANATAPVVRMDADQVHVPRLGWPWRDQPEQETHQDAVVLHDTGALAELIKKHRVRQRRGGPSPPTVDHLDDVVVVFLA